MSYLSVWQRALRRYREDGLVALLRAFDQKASDYCMRKLLYPMPGFLDMWTPRLKHVFIEPTNACNLKCKMCVGGKRAVGYMNIDFFEELIIQLMKMKVEHVTLHYGGESLLHPDFRRMVGFATQRIKTVDFFTNGMLFDEKVAWAVVDSGVDSVTFSLEGLGETNDAIRVGDDYAQVRRNILNLIDVRGSSGKPKVHLNMTSTTQTWDEIVDFVEEWLRSVPQLDSIRLCKCMNEDAVVLENPLFANKTLLPNAVCTAPFTDLVVLWDGRCVGCCHDINGRQVLGGVGTFSHPAVKRVWEGPGFRELRKACASKDFAGWDLCSTCTTWKYHIKPYWSVHKDVESSVESLFMQWKRRIE